eukprot:c22208_g1_i1 orf=360-2303(+)
MGRERIACLHFVSKLRAAQTFLQSHGKTCDARCLHNISDAGIHTSSEFVRSRAPEPFDKFLLRCLSDNVGCLRTFGTTTDEFIGDSSACETGTEKEHVSKDGRDALCLPIITKSTQSTSSNGPTFVNEAPDDKLCYVRNALAQEKEGSLAKATQSTSSDGPMFVNEAPDDDLCHARNVLAEEKEESKDMDIMLTAQSAKSETAMSMYHILKEEGWSSPDTEKKLSSIVNRVTPNLLIEVVKLLKNAEVGLSFLQWAKDQEGYEPRVEAFTHVIARFGREREFNRAWCLLVEMKRDKLAVDYAFSIFIHRLKRAKRAHGLVKAMCGMAFLGVTPTVALYTSALEFLLKFDHGDDVTHLYKQMLQDGLVPDKKLYELLIVGFIKIGKLDDSLSLFNDMQCQRYEPHVSVYSALLGSLVAAKKLDRGRELYMEMIRIGCLPKVFGLDEIACALHAENTTEMIDKFLKVVERTAARWRIQSHNNLLQYLLDTGRCDEAIRIFDKIPRDQKARAEPQRDSMNCYWTSDSYRIYILGLCKLGYLDHAQEMFKEMLARCLRPTNDISSFLLLSLSKARMVDEALSFCKHITGTRETVSIEAQHCFFSALRTSGRLSVALKIFLSMKRKGCIDQDSDFVSVIGLESKDELFSLMV